MSEIDLSIIENCIYLFRGQKVMLDSDLAILYDIETSQLNRQVRRNLLRFPHDFMFELTHEEFQSLMCQIGTSNKGRGGRQKKPLVFTESGVAMLSSVLNTDRAILVNISIMRIFIKLRSFISMEKNLETKINNLEQSTNKLFRIVFERLDSMDEIITTKLPNKKNRIGLKE